MRISTSDAMQSELEAAVRGQFGVPASSATNLQLFSACASLLRSELSHRRAEQRPPQGKQLHYLSMEFLLGRSLEKNAFNLGCATQLRAALTALGREPADILDAEPDAGLGNGGLGRLAACYLDSMTTLNIPATGYCPLYELGIFRQKIEQGGQKEVADDWHVAAKSWLVPCEDDTVAINFGGRVEQNWDHNGKCNAQLKDYTTVLAVPQDYLVSGWGTERVNCLRLWEARSPNVLDLPLFSSGDYLQAMEQRTMTEVITKVLYPADDHMQGKELRLKQQYFFVSATAQDIVCQHRRRHGSVRDFAEYHVIHINDTHPTLIIPELMRLFLDEDGLEWEEAWNIVSTCVCYTNHTVMSEALEHWPQGLVQRLLPRVWEILCEINLRWLQHLRQTLRGDEAAVSRNLILRDGAVFMANLCLATCRTINGVSKLHGDILRTVLFRDIAAVEPTRFTSVTNGIDHRRWLAQCNPRLHALVVELLGSDQYLRSAEELEKLRAFQEDDTVLAHLEAIKAENKRDFAVFLQRNQGAVLNTDAILDVQVKRLHEYKRQLLCAMRIVQLQESLHDDPNQEFLPRTFLFGAKAASGYAVAKRIIRLLCSLADDVNADPVCRDRLQVIFLENYRVTAAEHLMPAAQVSEQISTAGKEASGTGNMKLMMNGAITIGTLDGANVEMYERLGDENLFLFGLRAQEVAQLWERGYHPMEYYNADPVLRRAMTRLRQGFRDGESYSDLASHLLYDGDAYFLLADFPDYCAKHDALYRFLADSHRRAQCSLRNIAASGVFSADRAVRTYAETIWNL
ncbi:MAG: glycogen/starch/alpha-glucan phosphorylase [Oscillospiraceae bacterium]|jgi:starch phosphorylase